MGVCPGPWMVLVEEVKGGAEEVKKTKKEGDGGPWLVLPGPVTRLEKRGRRMIGPLGAPSTVSTQP